MTCFLILDILGAYAIYGVLKRQMSSGINFCRVAAADLHEGTADSQERRDSAAGGGRQQETHAQLCHCSGQLIISLFFNVSLGSIITNIVFLPRCSHTSYKAH
jgi:hypothetical protein